MSRRQTRATPPGPSFTKLKRLAAIGLLLSFCQHLSALDSSYGFALDRFPLTLEPGHRTEAMGPFFYCEQKETASTRAIPPFYSNFRDPAVEAREDDFLYPVLTYVRYGKEYRWQLFQLLSYAGGQEESGDTKDRFTIFPFYFQQRSTDTRLNYTALIPFGGRLKNRLFKDEIFFVLFPLYAQTRKRDVVTDNYLYPFAHVRRGDGLRGWQVWPLAGHERKVSALRTNGFGDAETVPGHDKTFYLWPFCFLHDNETGTDNPEKLRAFIPFYVSSRSPKRDATSVGWPFFIWIEEREKKYREWQGPWPFVIFARGEGKTTSRIWPLFSLSRNAAKQSDSYLWPLYTWRRTHSNPLDLRCERVLFWLYSRTVEMNTETGRAKKRLDMWPFFTWHRDFKGNERLQILALIEPIVPGNRGVERNWSPLWSLWRSETNPATGAANRSLLWNLYRCQSAPGQKKISLLFGIFQYQCEGENSRTKLFYITTSRKTTPPKN